MVTLRFEQGNMDDGSTASLNSNRLRDCPLNTDLEDEHGDNCGKDHTDGERGNRDVEDPRNNQGSGCGRGTGGSEEEGVVDECCPQCREKTATGKLNCDKYTHGHIKHKPVDANNNEILLGDKLLPNTTDDSKLTCNKGEVEHYEKRYSENVPVENMLVDDDEFGDFGDATTSTQPVVLVDDNSWADFSQDAAKSQGHTRSDHSFVLSLLNFTVVALSNLVATSFPDDDPLPDIPPPHLNLTDTSDHRREELPQGSQAQTIYQKLASNDTWADLGVVEDASALAFVWHNSHNQANHLRTLDVDRKVEDLRQESLIQQSSFSSAIAESATKYSPCHKPPTEADDNHPVELRVQQCTNIDSLAVPPAEFNWNETDLRNPLRRVSSPSINTQSSSLGVIDKDKTCGSEIIAEGDQSQPGSTIDRLKQSEMLNTKYTDNQPASSSLSRHVASSSRKSSRGTTFLRSSMRLGTSTLEEPILGSLRHVDATKRRPPTSNGNTSSTSASQYSVTNSSSQASQSLQLYDSPGSNQPHHQFALLTSLLATSHDDKLHVSPHQQMKSVNSESVISGGSRNRNNKTHVNANTYKNNKRVLPKSGSTGALSAVLNETPGSPSGSATYSNQVHSSCQSSPRTSAQSQTPIGVISMISRPHDLSILSYGRLGHTKTAYGEQDTAQGDNKF